MSEVDYVLHAEDLTPAHVGRRMRVAVLGGATIEDELVGYTVDNPNAVRIFLEFRTAKAAGECRPFFCVLPDTQIELVAP